MKETLTFTAHGTVYTYTLERKKVKNYNLRVKKDGSLYVSAPLRTPLARVEEFLMRQTDFIDRARKNLAKRLDAAPQPLTLVTGETLPIWGVLHTVAVVKGKKRHAEARERTLTLTVKDPENAAERLKCFGEFLDREAQEMLTARTETLIPLFAPKPAKMPALTFRTMKSKWGVCRPREERVTFNRNLVYLPAGLVDYVICHELAHFHHADHSTAFWQCLTAVMPDCKKRRKALNAFPVPEFQVTDASDTSCPQTTF